MHYLLHATFTKRVTINQSNVKSYIMLIATDGLNIKTQIFTVK